ncbi:fatty acid desaturase [Pseudomonas caricapapayae]|nr:fatty acid desaturase [Pseudomonas caricapapayae]
MPFYHLQSAHRQLVAQKLVPDENLYKGYGAVLRDVSLTTPKSPTDRGIS